MMNLLPMKDSQETKGEPVISLACGVPALSVGLGAMLLLLTHLVYVPAGSERFYVFVEVGRKTDSAGQIAPRANRLLPTMQLQGMLFVGACAAALGIHLSRRRWPHRRVTTSAAGLIACALAFCAGWVLWVAAAYVQESP
jgi:hypothetical protein